MRQRKLQKATTPAGARNAQRRALCEFVQSDKINADHELARMARERTLRYDEQAKSHQSASQALTVLAANVHNEHSIHEESREGYLIPRKSLASRLYLAAFPPKLELQDMPFRVLSQESRDELAKMAKQIRRVHPANRQRYADKLMSEFVPVYVNGTNSRLVWKSDQTFLRRNRIDSLSTVVVKHRSTNGTMTIDKADEPLPKWKPADYTSPDDRPIPAPSQSTNSEGD